MGVQFESSTSENGGWVFFIISLITQFVNTVYSTVASIININYEVVTEILRAISYMYNGLTTVVSAVCYSVLNICSCVCDFFQECCHFLYCAGLLAWKLCILIMSVVDLLFRSIEMLATFMLCGGKWTVDALQNSLLNLIVNVKNTYTFVCETIQYAVHLSSSVVASVGSISSQIVNCVYESLCYIFSTFWSALDFVLLGLAEGIRYISDNIYYFLVSYVPNIRRETCLGLIIIAVVYLVIKNLLLHVSRRGFTFPTLHGARGRRYRRFRNAPEALELSDIDEDWTADEDDDDFNIDTESNIDDDEIEVDISDTDEDDLDDEDSPVEFEVDDSSNSGSDNDSDTTSNHTIDIQLPSDSEGRYNLRRSTTPHRSKLGNLVDFEQEIEKEREKNKCVVCQDNNKSVLILPCRHMCLCIDCGNTIARSHLIARRVCPLCRNKIRTIMNVYT